MTKKEEAEARRAARMQKEMERVESLCIYEKEHADAQAICGIDEVGRGPLAGPVVAGAVILPKELRIPYINDSKKLSEKRRESIFEIIQAEAIATGIGIVEAARIDEINILQATYEAMRLAIKALDVSPDLLLVDAVTIPGVATPQVPLVKGDAKSQSIAAASILAKVTRDRMMLAYDAQYPQYHFASNKGYGTAAHIEGLRSHGPCPLHRRTFISKYV